jgi:AhpD family alkylhydroperoxidase
MQPRIDITSASPGALQAMLGLENYLHQCGLDAKLLDLVKLRVSQINGCAYCLDMHWKDLRAAGETEQRLYGLDAWRESPYYTERERAALAWAEAVTLVADTHVPDEVFDEARRHFSDEELADLTLGVVAINGFNRLNIAYRTTPGTYQPAAKEQHRAAT